MNNVYYDVGNVLIGADNSEEAYSVYQKAKEIFKRASMNLCGVKFQTGHSKLLASSQNGPCEDLLISDIVSLLLHSQMDCD